MLSWLEHLAHEVDRKKLHHLGHVWYHRRRVCADWLNCERQGHWKALWRRMTTCWLVVSEVEYQGAGIAL